MQGEEAEWRSEWYPSTCNGPSGRRHYSEEVSSGLQLRVWGRAHLKSGDGLIVRLSSLDDSHGKQTGSWNGSTASTNRNNTIQNDRRVRSLAQRGQPTPQPKQRSAWSTNPSLPRETATPEDRNHTNNSGCEI